MIFRPRIFQTLAIQPSEGSTFPRRISAQLLTASECANYNGGGPELRSVALLPAGNAGRALTYPRLPPRTRRADDRDGEPQPHSFPVSRQLGSHPLLRARVD